MNGISKRSPGVVFLTILCLVAFIVPRSESARSGLRYELWSPPSRLMFVERGASWQTDSPFPGLEGPFQLWQGEWWRIPSSAFHHENLFHLICNLVALVAIGPLCERRWGTLNTVLFMVAGGVISMCSEYLTDQHAIGFSGSICAAAGVLIVLRKSDDELADLLPDSLVILILVGLVLGIPLTQLGMVKIANLAHFSGLGYGWLIAEMMTRPGLKLPCLVGHLMIPLALWGCIHPEWNPRYHWYLAETLRSEQDVVQKPFSKEERAIRIRHLNQAWNLTHEHPGAGGELVAEYCQDEKWQEAWRVTLEMLASHSTNPMVQGLARKMWRRTLIEIGRDERDKILSKQLAERAPGWTKRFESMSVPRFDIESTKVTETLGPGRTQFGQPAAIPQDLRFPDSKPTSARERLEVPAQEGVLW